MSMYFELHKHTHFSIYDGFGLIGDAVNYAEELGHPALGVSDHGNTSALAKVYLVCKEKGIKPILGVEAYFQPVFNKEKEYYHLCLFAKNQQGYQNIMRIITEANTNNFYRTGKVTFELLEKYSEGIICTSACIAGFIPRHISKGDKALVKKAIRKFKSIFGDDFYFEIMPIKIDEKGTQRTVNSILYKLGKKFDIKCVPTTDSHFAKPEDYPSYELLMKGIKQSKYDIKQTYGERYMHSEKEIKQRLLKDGFTKAQIKEMLLNLEGIYNDINVEFDFSESVPIVDQKEVPNPLKELKKRCLQELKRRGKRHNKEYLERLKAEVEVIEAQHLSDYFLIVADYVHEAERRDIYVGPGRGSVCNCLVADLLGITKVDPVEIGNDFARFLRLDKKKMPDIDLDFEFGGRDEIMQYLLDKYPEESAQVITFGLYRTKNLCNDLIKVFEMEHEDAKYFRKIMTKHVNDNRLVKRMDIDYEEILAEPGMKRLNDEYENVVIHFCKLYGQIQYLGTHASGVVITRGPIKNWVSLVRYRDKFATCYDKFDCEDLGFLKFDILALKTLNILHEIEKATGDYSWHKGLPESKKAKVYEAFQIGKSSGVFQLSTNTAKEVLTTIKADTFQDIVAAISLNRPGPLKAKMHEEYYANKLNPPTDRLWYQCADDSYGTLIYQEHVMRMAKTLAGLEYKWADEIFKWRMPEERRLEIREMFVKGAAKVSKMPADEAGELFDSMSAYLFNKGHGSGYAMISEWHMYHKVFNTVEFWFAVLKHENDEARKADFMQEAVHDGVVLFLPHVNYTPDYSLRTFDGQKVIQEGLVSIKNVGQKAATIIGQERTVHGPFRSLDEFIERVPKRNVNKRVVESLLEYGALEFDKKTYLKRCVKYNSALYMKGMRRNGEN